MLGKDLEIFMRLLLRQICLLFFYGLLPISAGAQHFFLPMDATQSNHLKAYGMAYWVLGKGEKVDWLLNYRGGSFVFSAQGGFETELILRGISYDLLSIAEYTLLLETVQQPDVNTDLMRLEKQPRIAVYSPKTQQPWDDAVTLVLTYAQIPYDVIFDNEVLYDDLLKYDWLHLHHEDFTGQYGKFYGSARHTAWYQAQKREYEASAQHNNFAKVSQLKLAVAKKIQAFVAGGGFLFAMCSATDTYDIALAAEGVDICKEMFDGDPEDPEAQSKLDYSKTFAFKDFIVEKDPYVYEYSNIDMQPKERGVQESNDYFTLFQFSAKWDPIPTILTQNHNHIIKGFMGQTTAFRNSVVKSNTIIMGENKEIGEVRYLHSTLGKGFWTFYGGHDPENYRSLVGDPPTELNLHPNSPGYRLILNNILFPAAKKKNLKT